MPAVKSSTVKLRLPGRLIDCRDWSKLRGGSKLPSSKDPLNASAGIAGFEKSMEEENVQKLLPLIGNGFGLSVKKTKSKGTPSSRVKVNGAVAPGFTMTVSLPDAGSVRLDTVYSSGIAEAVGRIFGRHHG